MTIVVVMSLASPWARDTARRLRALGHMVHVVDFARPPAAAGYLGTDDEGERAEIETLRVEGIRIHLLPSRFRSELRYIVAAPRLRRLVRQTRGDVVLTLYGGGYAALAWSSGARPFAVYVVGSDVLLARGLVGRLSRHVLTRAGAVFCNGAYLAAVTRRFAPRARATQLYLGVTTSEFPESAQGTAAPRIVCTRGFLPVYNNEFLLEGLARRAPGAVPVQATFVSKGPGLEQARRLADRLLAPAQRAAVAFLGGVDAQRLRAELVSSQIYVSLSRSDGTSIALLEALASGLFPILSDIPQNREWIDADAGNGILVPLDDPDALASAIDEASSNVERRLRAAAYNRRIVAERADAPRNAGTLAARLQTLVRSRTEAA